MNTAKIGLCIQYALSDFFQPCIESGNKGVHLDGTTGKLEHNVNTQKPSSTD
jgi:hypothetical protein